MRDNIFSADSADSADTSDIGGQTESPPTDSQSVPSTTESTPLDNSPPETTDIITFEAAVEQVKKLVESGSKPSDACKETAKMTGYKKSELYAALVNE